MKREPSIAARSLRAVGLAITLVAIVTTVTVTYSATADYQNFAGNLKSGSPAISGGGVLDGSTLTLSLNVTAENPGLYPISVGLSCSAAQKNGATCTPAQATIPPGGVSTIRFRMSVPNGTQYVSGATPLHINGSVTVGLVPFASITYVEDWGALFRPGGSQ